MRTKELFEAARVVKKFKLVVRTGRHVRERELTEKSLGALNPSFMSAAAKKRALNLDPGMGFTYTIADDTGPSRVTITRSA